MTVRTDACVTRARETVYGPGWDDLYYLFQALSNQVIRQVEDDRAVTGAWRRWTACMRKQGFAEPTRAGVLGTVERQVRQAAGKSASVASAARAEIRTAVRDARCQEQAGLRRQVEAAQRTAERRVLGSYRDELSRLRSMRAHGLAQASSPATSQASSPTEASAGEPGRSPRTGPRTGPRRAHSTDQPARSRAGSPSDSEPTTMHRSPTRRMRARGRVTRAVVPIALGAAVWSAVPSAQAAPRPAPADPSPSTSADDHHAGFGLAARTPAPIAPKLAADAVRGLDVSSHQPNVDWPSVAAAGARFAYVKATEGTTYKNPLFGRQYNGRPPRDSSAAPTTSPCPTGPAAAPRRTTSSTTAAAGPRTARRFRAPSTSSTTPTTAAPATGCPRPP